LGLAATEAETCGCELGATTTTSKPTTMTVTQTTLHLPQTQPNQELHLNAAITPQQQRQPPWANNLMRRNQRNSTSDIRDHYRPPQITASTSRTPTLRNRRAAVGHQKTRSAAQDEVYRHCCENKTRLPQRTTTIAALANIAMHVSISRTRTRSRIQK